MVQSKSQPGIGRQRVDQNENDGTSDRGPDLVEGLLGMIQGTMLHSAEPRLRDSKVS